MNRKHTTTACQVCRESKIKCDGIQPACGSCSRKGKRCLYSSGNDRRKISLRTAVDVLLRRVEQLTQTCTNAGVQLPVLGDYEQSVIDEVSTLYGFPSVSSVVSVQSQTQQQQQQQQQQSSDLLQSSNPIPTNNPVTDFVGYNQNFGLDSLPSNEQPTGQDAFGQQDWIEFSTLDPWNQSPSDWPWHIMAADIDGIAAPGLIEPNPPVLPPTTEVTAEPNGSGAPSDDEAETDLIPRLAARFGSLRLAADGRLHYYGTASNLHFLGGSSTFDEEVDIRGMQRAATAALEHAQLDREVPTELEDHLIEEYFQWCNPCHPIINRMLFDKDRMQDRNAQGVYCSPALLAAICAVTAAFEGRYHRTFITFPKPLTEYFADKSKVLLEFEIERPCVSTLQTLLLLSSHEAAAGRDARMWLYSGMAMRLAFDLGLHVDSDPYIGQGLLTAEEADVRKATFWSCAVINHLWSFSLGRPFRIDSEENTVQKPSNSSISSLVLKHWVSFCEDLAPLIRVLYGCSIISKLSLQSLCRQASNSLFHWPRSIPEEIQIVDGRQVPHNVLLLHMAYHNFCILVHRPWTSKNSQPQGQIGPGFRHARVICRESASAIASLLATYELHYGFRRMHVYAVTIIFSASLILICGLIAEDLLGDKQNTDAISNVMGDLNTCFRALDEMSQSYECAKRCRHQLLEIQRHWTGRKKEARTGSKRGSQPRAIEQDIRYKRSRPSQSAL